jgi:gamma-aminobutyric acid receptor subunit beta
MYWTSKPVTGVEDAKLPQFTIVGYETTDRMEKLATGIIYFVFIFSLCFQMI